MMLHCKKCNSDKKETEFSYDPVAKNRNGRTYYCKICAAINGRKNYNKNRLTRRTKANAIANKRNFENKRWAVEYMGNHCFDCKQQYEQVVYDFHHIDGKTKEYNPSKALTLSREVAIRELSKCVLLCANCHRLRHWRHK